LKNVRLWHKADMADQDPRDTYRVTRRPRPGGVSDGESFQDQSGGSTATISAAAPQTGIRYGYSIW
jgi:hypothetical protein